MEHPSRCQTVVCPPPSAERRRLGLLDSPAMGIFRVALLLALLSLACVPAGPGPVVVLAASSLGALVEAEAQLFEAQGGGAVQVRVGASSALARQLLDGLNAQLFLSASPQWAAEVQALETRPWLGNRLVWAVAAHGPQPRPGEAKSLALGLAEVPVGQYAAVALEAAGLALPPRVVRGRSARDTVAILRSGGAEAAVVYRTDVIQEPDLRVQALLPPDGPAPVTLSAALLSEEGRPFFHWLLSPAARARALAAGFEPLP